ncbi:putative dolichyl-phosphate-mannose--protein mannosyltransferase [Candidatus Calditenuaceae archaeon HR02]|nr:putative dolichyl-phosphate-mannose--protein mannosyltransferase [Candidatus Calditenuaceae archaeon HR02]
MRRSTIYIIVLAGLSLLLRVYRLDIPDKLIGDEVYYVPAARSILGLGEVGVPTDPRVGHPPLGKMLIALGILIFGDQPFGWRIMSAVAGTAAIPLFYLTIRRLLSGRKEMEFASTIASFLFAFETLTFYFSRVARIDIFMLVFLLAGIYFLLDDRPNRKIFSAPFFAASFLSKEAALVVVVPLLFYMGLRVERKRMRRQVLRYDWKTVLFSFAATGGSIVALWYFLEWVLLVPKASNIVERIMLMFSRLSISNPRAVGRSEIWQWFFNYPVTKAVEVRPGSGLNPANIVTGPLITPSALYAYFVQVSWTIIIFMLPIMVYSLLRSIHDPTAMFIVFYWFGGLLGWIVVNSVFRGLIYLFYLLPLLPPVIIAISQYLGTRVNEEWATQKVRWTGAAGLYLLLHLVNFAALYPVPIF